MEFNPNVLAYYNLGLESDRLRRHSLERIRTESILRRFLPPTPARVLDVGGGDGIYAFHLAERGYQVDLVDPIPLHLEQARERQKTASCKLHHIGPGDARQLPYEAGSADAVLYLGPLYHLTDARERGTALDEARRVLRPRGLLLTAYISRFASVIDGLLRGWLCDEVFHSMIRQDLATGQHRNPSGNPAYFTDAYFHHPAEAREELRQHGFEEIRLITVEGPFWTMPDIETKLTDPQWVNCILDLAERMELEETLLGVGAHFIACARTASS